MNELVCDDVFKPFSSLILGRRLLRDYPADEVDDFVRACLGYLAKRVGGFKYFWADEEKRFVFDGWVDGLKDCLPMKIMSTINRIMDGSYKKRDDFVPRNVMDFKWFMKEISHQEVDRMLSAEVKMLGYDEDEARKKSVRAAKFYMEKIWKELGAIQKIEKSKIYNMQDV